MRRLLFALLAAPLPAMAQGAQCWIPYPAFEEKVPHMDLDRCPDDSPKPEEGFCRIMLQGNDILVYAFRHDAQAGMPCLVRVDRMPVNDWIRARGVTNPIR